MVTWLRNEKVDVVIVGAGASGSTFAAVLAKAGKKVVLLDDGPDWQLTDLIRSDIWGRRIKPAGAPFLLEGKNPFGYAYQAGWGVGGAALHYFANFPRLLPNDFTIKSEHDRALDWPITYDDVAPYYDKVAHDIGMSGDAKAEEVWRPAGAPYPMPPMKTFRNGEVWLKGFEANGIRMVPAAVAMNSTEFKGRAGLHLRRLVPCRLPDRRARQSAGDVSRRSAQGGRRGARALDRDARAHQSRRAPRSPASSITTTRGERQVQEASVVIARRLVGAEPAPPAQLGDRQAPEGPRQCERARRQIHHDALHRPAPMRCSTRISQNHMGTIGAQFMSYERYAKTAHKGAFGSTVHHVRRRRRRPAGWPASPTPGPTCSARAARLHEARREGLHPHRRRPARSCRTSRTASSSSSEKDEFGMPLGRIVHSYDDDAAALWNANFEEGLKIAQGDRRQGGLAARGDMPTIHLMGGTIMGTGAGNSVVNSYGQTHEIAEPLRRRPRHLPDRRRRQPDLHHLRAVAARRRAAGEELGHGRGVGRPCPGRGAARSSCEAVHR